MKYKCSTFKIIVAVSAGLSGMKGLYQPVKVDSKAIKEFMAFYHILKQQFKMHLLEDHAVQWTNTYHSGFGLLGEQGAESIHAKFNRLWLPFRMCIVIIPQKCCVKSYFQISCECIALIAGFPQPLSTHSTTNVYLLYVVIHIYNHVPGTYTCTNETITCIDYSLKTLRLFVVIENASPL